MKPLTSTVRDIVLKLFVISSIIIYIVNLLLHALSYYSTPEYFDDTSCHYEYIKGDLPSIDDQNLHLPQKSIFFHETSCKGGLNLREACCVESAARANPNWQINVIFTGPTRPTKARILSKLKKLNNIKLFRAHVTEYSKGTPLDGLLASHILNRSMWRVQHTSDILRYMTLYKFGGVYLDLDVIVAKSFDTLPSNWVVKEDYLSIAAGVIAISRDGVGRKISNATVNELLDDFQPLQWSYNSVGVITRALNKTCSFDGTNIVAAQCPGFKIFEPEYFYPIHYTNWECYYQPGMLMLSNAYGYHLWNHLSWRADVTKESLVARLAERYCPSIYQVIKNEVIFRIY